MPVVTATYCLPPALYENGGTLHGLTEAGLPEHLPRTHVERLEVAIGVTHEHEAAGRRDRRGEERRSLLVAPQLRPRFRIVTRDETALILEPFAAVDAAHEHAARDDRPARVGEPLRVAVP